MKSGWCGFTPPGALPDHAHCRAAVCSCEACDCRVRNASDAPFYAGSGGVDLIESGQTKDGPGPAASTAGSSQGLSVYRQARGRHSKKPDVIRNQIASWWPNARRLEMFCRYPAPGWHVWGNQVDSTAADLPFERFDPHADPAQDSLFGGAA